MKKFSKNEIRNIIKPILKQNIRILSSYFTCMILTTLCFFTKRFFAFYGCLGLLIVLTLFLLNDIKRAIMLLLDIANESVEEIEGIFELRKEIKLANKEPIYHIIVNVNKKVNFISPIELKNCSKPDLIRVFYTKKSKVLVGYELISKWNMAT